MHLNSIWSCLLIVCWSLAFCEAYKFLGIMPTGARSHFQVGSALLKTLANRGHEVTVISGFPLKKPLKNYHDIPVTELMESIKHDKINLLESHDRSLIKNILIYHEKGLEFVRTIMEEPKVKALMASNQTFDAILCEVFLSETLFGFSEHYKAPLIGFSTFGAISWNTDMVGSPSPPSYVPNPFLQFTDHMSLLQRVGNLAFLTFERIFYDFYYLPRQELLYKKYFPHLKRSMYDVRKNAALILLNQHVSLSFPRPYVPNQIEVGGMHINREAKPLPADIRKFIEESPHGVIYFSIGSNIKSTKLPLEKREQLFKAFRGLKQRVLWKFEDPNMPGKPDNVFITEWFPQDDILAHKNVLAFITHGGLLSIMESIYHGKPFIGIPIFGDQFLNMARAEAGGFGIRLDYDRLDGEKLRAAIERIVSEPSYGRLVRDMSTRFRDQPMDPLEKAVFWTEHVVRHKGAKYLHCAGQDLNFIQYHNLDVILILYGGIALVLFLIMWSIRFVVVCLWNVLVRKPKAKVKTN